MKTVPQLFAVALVAAALTPVRAQVAVAPDSMTPAEKIKAELGEAKKLNAPAGKETAGKPGDKAPSQAADKQADKDAQREADIKRFKQILADVKAGNAITKEDQKWAVDKLNEELKKVDSGEVENKIVAAQEAKIDKMIADGKVPKEAKPEIMKQIREQVHEQLQDIAAESREVVKAIQNAKTK